LAKKIVGRKKFFFAEKKIPKLKKWVVKSSSSLSGVLHIGRLSDLARGEAVYRALKEQNFPVEFVYVTEDMDPLRKIPKGVPESFEKYIGFPVSDIPDPWGCHKSYDKHHLEHFLGTISPFLSKQPKVFSMREEYQKGSFNEMVFGLMARADALIEILNKFKTEPIASGWIPWKPICQNCGNLQTTRAIGFDGKSVEYVCEDYKFETKTAKGCGFHGFSDLKKANGKMPWKSEWAMQWRFWNVCSEGAGKEYESRNSAFWINAEICEKLLDFPMPEPIFYEHLMVDGVKMSASLGNVVYPSDWLKVSRPETLRLLYLKKLMKTRSFSWNDIPLLEVELDRLVENVKAKKGDAKEFVQSQRLLHFVEMPNCLLIGSKFDFATAIMLAQLFAKNQGAFLKLEEMGFVSSKSKEIRGFVFERLNFAREFAVLHLSAEQKIRLVDVSEVDFQKIDSKAKQLFFSLAARIETAKSAEDIQAIIYDEAKSNGLEPAKLFNAIYLALLNRDNGPKIGSLVFAFGKEKVCERLRQIK
jgi:lysyl-tRNA synthetase class 1